MRSILVDRALDIVADQQQPVSSLVGVFVNEPPDHINKMSKAVGLHYVQLHGDETPDIASAIVCPIIRAVRIINGDHAAAAAEINAWRNAGVAAVLLDKGSSKQYGGTGEAIDWSAVSKIETNVPFILAGGLKPDNVATAIATAKPAAVDVASGVEKFPGAKDETMLRAFIDNAKRQFLIERQ